MNNTEVTIDKFWKLIEEINWPNTKPGKVKKLLIGRFSVNEFDKYFDIYDDLLANLENRVYEFLADKGMIITSYDTFDAIVSHVIGLGKEEYSKAMENPGSVVDRISKEDFSGGFAQCLPYPEEWEYVDISYYKRLAKTAKDSYTNIDATLASADDCDKIINNLGLLEGGNVSAFLATEEQTLSLTKKIEQSILNEIDRVKIKLGKFTPIGGCLNGGTAVAPHHIENIYNDIKSYLIDE